MDNEQRIKQTNLSVNLGLGVNIILALVKSIAERHGGSVRCEAREGGGACFTVRLPRSVS